MMHSTLDAGQEAAYLPLGPAPGSDTRLLVQGILLGVDTDAREATISVAGGEGAIVPLLLPQDYTDWIGLPVQVLRDPISGRSVGCLGLAGPELEPDDEQDEDPGLPETGKVTAISSGTVTVDAAGGPYLCRAITSAVVAVGDTVLLMWSTAGAPWVLGKAGVSTSAPSTPSAPGLSRTGGTVTVTWALPAGATSAQIRRSTNGGKTWKTTGHGGTSTKLSMSQGQRLTVQVRAIGPGGNSSWSGSSSVTYPKPAPTPPKVVTKTVTINPTWSGTYRNQGGWDRWNTNRYGGRSTLYQGSAHSSGPLKGLATYGNQIANLKATAITKIEVTLRGAGLGEGSFPSVSVQGSPHGSKPGGAPSSSGATASGSPGQSGTDKVSLPSSVRENMRTGDVKGLALVGSGYAAVRGTSLAGAMSLRITYETEQ